MKEEGTVDYEYVGEMPVQPLETCLSLGLHGLMRGEMLVGGEVASSFTYAYCICSSANFGGSIVFITKPFLLEVEVFFIRLFSSR